MGKYHEISASGYPAKGKMHEIFAPGYPGSSTKVLLLAVKLKRKWHKISSMGSSAKGKIAEISDSGYPAKGKVARDFCFWFSSRRESSMAFMLLALQLKGK
jgi:hypothetical protein